MQVFRKACIFLFLTVLAVRVPHCSSLPTSEATEPSAVQSTNGDGDAVHCHSQILIVGAGPSGVAAASRLMQNGVLDVMILEAEDRIGGRIHSIPFGENFVDLGAQWVQGVKGNVVYEMANPYGLLEENAPSIIDGMLYLQANGTVPDQGLLRNLLNISLKIEGSSEDMLNYNFSLGEYFSKKFSEEISSLPKSSTENQALLDAFHKWMRKADAFANGADWLEVSAKGINQSWECEGDQTVNWRNNGYYSVFNLLTKRYPNPEQELPVRNKTRLRTEVKKVHWGPNAVVGPTGKKIVLVETTDGARYTADTVLVTVSLGVLKEKAETMFSPRLPANKMNAIQNLGFGQVDKIFLQFNETWWPVNNTGISFMASDQDEEQFNQQYPQYSEKGEWVSALSGFYRVPSQPNHTLFDWIVGAPARNMEKYTDNEVQAACLLWMEKFLGRQLPQPVSFTRSKWYSNPHFRGSYSFRSLDSEKYGAQPAQLAEPILGQEGNLEVLFAGEATNDHHAGYVHGAVETGWREADRILNSLGRGKSQEST